MLSYVINQMLLQIVVVVQGKAFHIPNQHVVTVQRKLGRVIASDFLAVRVVPFGPLTSAPYFAILPTGTMDPNEVDNCFIVEGWLNHESQVILHIECPTTEYLATEYSTLFVNVGVLRKDVVHTCR